MPKNTITVLPRIFIFKNAENSIELPDINTDLSPDDIIDFHATTYVELTNAIVKKPKLTQRGLEYEVISKFGEKS